MSNRKKIKYFSVKDLKKVSEGALYTILLSGRNTGKSYATKSYCLQEAFNSIHNGICDSQLAYLRRFDLDCKDSMCEPYFADMPVQEITKNAYSVISVYHHDIYFGNIDEKTNKVVRQVKIGRCFALSVAEHYKSQMFPKIMNMIYEEILSQNNNYLFDECTHMQHFVSSIFRDRENCKVFMIGNTLSRMCPYYKDFGLVGVESIKEGETRQYKVDESVINVHRCKPVDYNASMFFGKARDSIVKGEYLTNTYPHLKKHIRKYIIQHQVVLEYDQFRYFLRLLTDPEDNTVFWYVEPLTTEYKEGTRIISNQWKSSNYHSYNFRGVTPEEAAAFALLIRDNKVVFSDNLTGTEFNNIIKYFK